MARYKRSDEDRQRELEEESSRRKKGQQPIYDQLKAQDENVSEHSKDILNSDYSPLLMDSHSAEGPASLITELQQSHGNAYVQQLIERIEAAKGTGQPLKPQVRTEMEGAFGEDFKHIRIHTGATSAKLSEELGAEAFTAGRDIFFNRGVYQPGSQAGKKLLKHELTHVVQQKNDSRLSDQVTIDPNDAAEKEASNIASASFTTTSAPARITKVSTTAIQRETEQGEEEMPSWLKKKKTTKEEIKVEKLGKSQINDIKRDLSGALTRAQTNCNTFSLEVNRACDLFKKYANSKIKKLSEGEFPAGELLSALLNAGLGMLKTEYKGLIEKVQKYAEAKTGETNWKLAQETIDKTFSDKVQKALAYKGKTDTESLESAVNEAIEGAKDCATRLATKVHEEFGRAVKELGNELDTNGFEYLTKAQHRMVLLFYGGSPDLNDRLENYYGVPSAASAREIQLHVYKNLVRAFEEKYIWVEAKELDFKERMRKRALAGLEAKERAETATEERRKELAK
jgi:hypothetical protein